MRLSLYMVAQTDGARLYRNRNDAELWVPRSVCPRVTKYPPTHAGALPLHDVEIEDWWLEKNPWPAGQRGLGI